MPRRKSKSAPGKSIPLVEAARVVGASTTAVGKWVREDKVLRAMLQPGARGARLFSEDAVARLKKIRDERFAAAGPGLRKAWEARKRKGGSPRAARSAATARPGSTPVRTAEGISGARAAKALGVAKPRLYEIMKRAGIRKPAERNAFTPTILQQIRDAMGKGQPQTKAAQSKRPRPAPRAGGQPRAATTADVGGDLSATVAKMIETTVGSAREEARVLARRALQEARDALDRGLKALG